MSKIVIIGFGEIGRAINFLLQLTANDIELWDRDPNKVPEQEPLEQLVPNANFLFLCVPSWALEELIIKIKPLVKKQTILVTATKGVDPQNLKTVDQLLSEAFPENPVVLLGGPMLAEELMAGKKGFAVAASKDEKASLLISDLFKDSNLTLERSNDVLGVALCGVLKNIYSVCIGIADGLDLGNNFKGKLAVQAFYEMTEITQHLGGSQQTIQGLAGYADFIATGFSDFSSNRKSGYVMGKKGTCELKSEGIASVKAIIHLLGENISNYPLLIALDRACVESQDTRLEFEKLFLK